MVGTRDLCFQCMNQETRLLEKGGPSAAGELAWDTRKLPVDTYMELRLEDEWHDLCTTFLTIHESLYSL